MHALLLVILYFFTFEQTPVYLIAGMLVLGFGTQDLGLVIEANAQTPCHCFIINNNICLSNLIQMLHVLVASAPVFFPRVD